MDRHQEDQQELRIFPTYLSEVDRNHTSCKTSAYSQRFVCWSVNRWINFSPQIHRNFSGKKTDLQHVRMMSSYGMRRNDSIEIALEVRPFQNARSRINSRLLSSFWYSFVIFD